MRRLTHALVYVMLVAGAALCSLGIVLRDDVTWRVGMAAVAIGAVILTLSEPR